MMAPAICWLLLERTVNAFLFQEGDVVLAPLLGFGFPLPDFCLQLIVEEGIGHQMVIDAYVLAASIVGRPLLDALVVVQLACFIHQIAIS